MTFFANTQNDIASSEHRTDAATSIHIEETPCVVIRAVEASVARTYRHEPTQQPSIFFNA